MTSLRNRVLAGVAAAGLSVLAACGTSTGSAAPAPSGSGSGISLLTGTALSNNANKSAGDFYRGSRSADAATKWVQLSTGKAGGLSPIVRDAAGFTMYRFDKDTAEPSASNCNGDCAKTWPPVLVKPGSRVFVDEGIATKDVGFVTRADGARQITIGGWPIYRFSKDTAPGQTNGQGVGGTWFAVSPTGAKAGGTDTAPSSAPDNGGGVQLGNGSATLFSGVNFQEPNGSSGVSGPGCVAVPRPKQVVSIDLGGGPVKLWKGPDCTGESTVLSGSIADLSTIGFDRQVVSIRFGDE